MQENTAAAPKMAGEQEQKQTEPADESEQEQTEPANESEQEQTGPADESEKSSVFFDPEVQEPFPGKSPEAAVKLSKPKTEKHRRKSGKKKKSSAKTSKHKNNKEPSEPGIFTKIRTYLSRLHKEFTDEVNRQSVSHLWKELLKILRNYKPRKLKADISFSLADPALTGGAAGLISLVPWIYRYPCSMIPDFISEQMYIEGEIEARGKAAVYIFLISLLRLLCDRQFMQVFRRLMKRDGSEGT